MPCARERVVRVKIDEAGAPAAFARSIFTTRFSGSQPGLATCV